ncbi:MAG TPA: multicopper oxidase domain-containing protein [Pyrinomonadaceae bacterium]|nr:multicopper oxidase domain-containing protein [Pyrinomonadaceae bacterium]
MSVQTLRLHLRAVVQEEAARPRAGGARRCRVFMRRLSAGLFAAAALLSQAAAARAQQQEYIPCPPEQQTLLTVPMLAAQNNILRGTIVLGDEQQAIPFRLPPQSKPGDPGSIVRCQPQYVRTLRGVGAVPAPPAPTGQFPNPMPGPTLRARVGDIINLTFINQINPGHFGRSIDNGEKGFGCDQPIPPGDAYPDCFHGSSTGNIHFHGSHTNPNNTGDNVFVEVRPLPRNNQGNLTTTPQEVQEGLDRFYAQCNERLKISPLVAWPKVWEDMPPNWAGKQKNLLSNYDEEMKKAYGIPPAKALSPTNDWQIKNGYWPQYYIGVFPYCFRLPEYTEPTWPPPKPVTVHTHQVQSPQLPRAGAGTAELNSRGVVPPEQMGVSPTLIMGQAPGTHWYHAHKHGSTAINVANGMTGVFIMEGSYDDDLNAFYGANWTRTQPVMVINQLGVTPNLLRGGQGGQGGIGATDKGPDFSINGQIRPVVNMRPNEVQMWRVVNTAGRAGVYFHTPPAAQYEWRQLAQDGVQFNDFNYKARPRGPFLLASGNRADLLVQAKPCPGGAKTCQYPVIVQNQVDPSDLASANNLTLLTINVSGDPVSTATPAGQFIPQAPRFPAFLKDISDDEITGTKIMTFGSTSPGQGGQHTIDGKKFDGEVGALVQLNRVEEWKIQNATYGPKISHPFHIHINPFQVTEIFDPNATINVTYTDPKTKKKLTANNVKQYAFVPDDLFKILGNPGFQAYVRSQQCQLDPQADPVTWKPCGPPFKNVNNIWWDVFPIPSGRRLPVNKIDPKTGQPVIDPKTNKPVPVQVPGYFKMRSRFVDYAGYYVLHCHILAHEDRGMMTVVEVAPATTPYSHN